MDKDTKITYVSKAGSVVFDTAGDIWIERISGLQTDIDIISAQTVGQIGAAATEQSVQPKTPTINGVIVRNIKFRRERLLAAVVPLEMGKLIIEQDDQKWFLEGYPKQTPALSDGKRAQHFQFQLFCPYPYLRTLDNRTYQLSGLTALWQTPFTVGPHEVSRYGQDAFILVENTGSVPQPLILNVYAVAEVMKPSIFNVESGQKITINKTMKPGEQMIISTYDRDKDDGTAVRFIDAKGAEHNGYRYLSPDSDLDMRVAPGMSTFTMTAEGNGHNCRCGLTTAGGERHSL